MNILFEGSCTQGGGDGESAIGSFPKLGTGWGKKNVVFFFLFVVGGFFGGEGGVDKLWGWFFC